MKGFLLSARTKLTDRNEKHLIVIVQTFVVSNILILRNDDVFGESRIIFLLDVIPDLEMSKLETSHSEDSLNLNKYFILYTR